jgi:aminomethyltransferase
VSEPRYTVLRDRHEALGAAFTDFGGWLMPVRYGSDLAEHRAVREAAGLFDISHMAEVDVRGARAGAFLDHALAGRLSVLVDDQAKYSLLLADDGGIVDDLIVYRRAGDRFLVIANAGNRAAVVEALAAHADRFDVDVVDLSDQLALLAVQGPRAAEILAATAGLGAFSTPLEEQKYYRMAHARFTVPGAGTVDVDVARTGYTGEDGFELVVPVEAAPALWDALLAAGAPRGLVPAGLAARDTLRLEAGMPLYGHELSRGVRPAQAGLGRVVVSAKDDFVGKAGVEPDADAPVLVGLVSEGRRAGRAGYAVYCGDERVGEVTSGALSPTLQHPIAMAYVAPAVSAPDTELTIDVRGARVPATVTTLPFYRRNR